MRPVGGWISRLTQRFAVPRAASKLSPIPFRRKFIVEALEPRLLMSADLLPVIPPPPPDPTPAALPADAIPQFHFDASDLAADFAAAMDMPLSTPDDTIREIAFVDSRIVGQGGVSLSRDGLLVVVLDAGEDGLAKISEILEQHDGLKAVHLLAHGGEGHMVLGDRVLDGSTLDEAALWGEALAGNGDLLLYGCSVADGELGVSFARSLAHATGADVGASTNVTGNGDGDWVLEFTTGLLEAGPLSIAGLEQMLATFALTGGTDTHTTGSGNGDLYTLANSTFLTAADTITDAGSGDQLVLSVAANLSDTAFTNVTGIEEVVLGHFVNSLTLGTEFFQNAAAATGATTEIDASAQTAGGQLTVTFNAIGASGRVDIVGGADADTLSFGSTADDLYITINNDGSIDVRLSLGGAIRVHATGVERIVGGAGDDIFIFDTTASLPLTVNGGAGSNTLDYSSRSTAVTVNLVTNSATGVGVSISNIQNAVGGGGADSFTGNSAANSFSGGAGHDTLLGGSGEDTLDGGAGNDSITGGADDDSLVGGSGDDQYVFGNGWGADSITENASGGADTMDFSAVTGAVSLHVALSGSNEAVTVGDDPDAPGNEVSAVNLENVIGGAGADTYAFAEGTVWGGDLDGGGGNDILDYADFGGNIDPDELDFASGLAPGLFPGNAADNFEFIQHPMDAVRGLQEMYDTLREGFDSTIGAVTLPLIGDAIGDGITAFLDEMEEAMLGDGLDGGKDGLIEALLTSDDDLSTDQIIEDTLAVTTLSHDIGSANLPATLSWIFDASQLSTLGIFEIRMVIEGTLYHGEVDIDFAGALPGLGLSIETAGGLEVDLSYVLNLGIGLDFNGGGFYIDTNGQDDDSDEDDAEFVLTLTAGLTEGTSLAATLGFLGMSLVDQTTADDTADTPDDGTPSGITGVFDVDLLDPGTDGDDGHLKMSEFAGASASDLIEAHLTGDANVDLVGVLDMGTAVLPSISTILHYDQHFGDVTLAFGGGSFATAGDPPTVVFEDVTLDLGSFFTDFLEPILTEVKKVTEPLQPVVDILTARLPILSDVSFLYEQFNFDNDADNDVTLLDLVGTLAPSGKIQTVVRAIDAIADAITFINNIPTGESGGLKINFGDHTFGGGGGDDVRQAGALKNASAPTSTNANPGAQLDAADSTIGGQIDNTPENAQKKGALAKLRGATDGFNIPLLNSPSTVFSLLMGKDVPLFTFDIPDLVFDFAMNLRVPLFGPLFMKLSGSVEATIKAGFGYSTAGITSFIASGDAEDIFLKGFYFNDHWVGGVDQPEVFVTSTISAFAALGIGGLVEAGVGGGVTASIAFDLNDVATSEDGKIFLNEFIFIAATDPLCIFDIHGKIEGFLEAYVWVGLDLGIFGEITIFEETWELARIVIAEFHHECDIVDLPVLANLTGGVLTLHMGTDAGARDGALTDWHTGYEDETYTVNRGMYDHDENEATAKIDRIAVSWNGFVEYYDPTLVQKIKVNDAGSGDDIITIGKDIAAELTIHGGAGNDVIRTDGSGIAFITGGSGNDKIVGAVKKTSNTGTHSVSGQIRDRFEGGADNDFITGSGADDQIYGGTSSDGATTQSGNDVIKGNAGNDTIIGGYESGSTGSKANGDSVDAGAGNDSVSGGGGADGLRGGAGNDTLDGGAGDDALTGGTGIDSLVGGAGADNITWTSGDGADIVAGGSDGGTEPMDTFIGNTLATTGEAITLAKSGANVQLSWDAVGAGSPTTFALSGIEKFQINAGTGADVITVNDLAGTTVKDVGISLGATVVDTQVDDASAAGFHLETVTTLDSSADILNLYGSATLADTFDIANATSSTLTIVRQGVMSYSVTQGNAAQDTLNVFAGGGADTINAATVTAAVTRFVFNGEADNDRLIGSNFADQLNGGSGDDSYTGNGGLDVFVDSGHATATGDILIETRNSNFTLSGSTTQTLQIGSEGVETVTLFERFTLTGGASANTFSLSSFNDVALLDGAGGGDTYNITVAASGTSDITENDSGGTIGLPDVMNVFGTGGGDVFHSTARTTTTGTIATAVVNGDQTVTDQQKIHYNVTETLDVWGGAGDDLFIVDDTSMEINFRGEADRDTFQIGRVLGEETLGGGIGDSVFVTVDGISYDQVVVVTSITNGVTYPANFYGGTEGDTFQVDHNLAEIWMYGEDGNDNFVINAHLENDRQSNISGGLGTNDIQYVQNAKVYIDGGAGFDTVTINGTGINDVFVVDTVFEDHDANVATANIWVQKVVGAGLQIGSIANVERLTINGAGGDDTFHVYGTVAGLDLVINGGTENDTIYIGGAAATVNGVTPAHFEQPDSYTIDPEPYISGYATFTFNPDPYWYWDGSWPFYHYYDPPAFTIAIPIIVDPAPYVYTPPKVHVPAQAYTFTGGPYYSLDRIGGNLSIDGGPNSGGTGDRVVVNNSQGSSAASTIAETVDADLVHFTTITGMGIGGAINLIGNEQVELEFGSGNDVVTVNHILGAGSQWTLNLNDGDDRVDLKSSLANVVINGGAGNDVANLGSVAPTFNAGTGTLANIDGTVKFFGGANADTLNVDASGNGVAALSLTLTKTTLSGLNLAGGITDYAAETVNIASGAGNDTVEVRGTSGVTTVWANGGNDTITASSTGTTTTGNLDDIDFALTLHAGIGSNTLNVSDFTSVTGKTGVSITSSTIANLAPALITYDALGGGRFTGGVNIWAGKGNDQVTLASTLAGDVMTIDANDGADTVTVSAAQAADVVVVIGGAGADTLTASATTTHPVVMVGDKGLITYGATTKSFANLTGVGSTADAGGGNDTMAGGTGRLFAIGGEGADSITSNSSLDDALVGDNGEILFATSTIVTRAHSLHPGGAGGGGDSLSAGLGNNILIGGIGADTLGAGAGNDFAIGDNGDLQFDAAGRIDLAESTESSVGGGDTIGLGDGNNVAIGGFGADSITSGAGTDHVIGDNGRLDYTIGAVSVLTRSETTDTIAGTGGDDTIVTGGGVNVVLGGIGSDRVNDGATPSSSGDVMLGDNGYVTWTAGGVITAAVTTQDGLGGADTLNAGDGLNVVLAGAGGDTVTTGGDSDVVIGDNGSATWTGGILTEFKSSDTVAGTGGNDTIGAGAGNNFMIGGVGNDSLTSGAGNDVALGDNGEVNFDLGGIIIDATVTEVGLGGGDIINVDGGNNVVLAGAGADSVTALAGTDVVIGDSGSATWTGVIVTRIVSSDTGAGTGGNDTIGAGDGNNYLIGGVGSDSLTAGAGNDVVLGDNGEANFFTDGVITYTTVSEIGLGGADVIAVGAGDNVVLAGADADSVTALGGSDVVIGDSGSATWTGGIVTRIVSSDTQAGTGGNDTIGAGDGHNYLIGGVGNDSLTAGAGNDVVLGDNGEANFFTDGVITYATVSEIGLGGADVIAVGAGDNVVLAGADADSVTALGGSDVAIGDNGSATWTGGIVTRIFSSDTQAGTGGNDTIAAGAGNNYMIGGVGNDSLTAGAGNDVALGDNGEVNFEVVAAEGVITDATVTEIGLGGADTIDVDAGDNVVLAGAGADSVTALAGTDLVIGDNGSATWVGGIVTQIVSSDTQAGTGGNDTIGAGDGDNYLIGGVGVDGITAGSGNDVVLGDNGEVNFFTDGVITDATVSELGLGGGDTLTVGGGNNVVLAGAGADSVSAAGGADVVFGDNGTAFWTDGIVTQIYSTDTQAGTGGNDTLGAGDGDNYVVGGVGADSLASGSGNDVVLGDNGEVNFDIAGIITDATVTDIGLGDADVIAAGGGNNVVLAGAGGDMVTALGGNDVVIGDNGEAIYTDGAVTEFRSSDTQGGTGGNDTISAGDGNNLLLGGVGSDDISGGTGNDLAIGDNGAALFDTATYKLVNLSTTDNLGESDTIVLGDGVNFVLGGAGGDGVTTGSGNDIIVGDNGRVLYTAAGVVTLFETTDHAFGGDDTVIGGAGNNVIAGGFGADEVTTLGGHDLVLGDNGSFTFSSGLLSQALTTDVDDTTAGNDTIGAGDGNNVILGGLGGDRITTGSGLDVVIGDNGVARYQAGGVIQSVETRDPLQAGDDYINVGAGADVVIGGGGSDTIIGGSGADVLLGDGGIAGFSGGRLIVVEGDSDIGAGDSIDGGAGSDILLGGAGLDTLVANLTDDLFTGETARITLSGGAITNIQLMGPPDLVLQQLFQMYSGGPADETATFVQTESVPQREVLEQTLLALAAAGAPGGLLTEQGVILSTGPGGLALQFGRSIPLSQMPELLRNMVIELYMGSTDSAPSHAGESDAPPAPSTDGEPVPPAPATEVEAPFAHGQEIPADEIAAAEVAEFALGAGAAAAFAGLARQRPVLERAGFERREIARSRIDW